jgi:hypothetical protein
MALENGKFTCEQVNLPEFLERHQVEDLVPGAIAFIESDAFIVTEDSKCWIDGKAEIQALEYGKTYIHVIQLEEGLVVELVTPYSKPTDFLQMGHGKKMNAQQEMTGYAFDIENLIPVVAVITNEEHLLALDKTYKKQNGYRLLKDGFRKELKERQRHRLAERAISASLTTLR